MGRQYQAGGEGGQRVVLHEVARPSPRHRGHPLGLEACAQLRHVCDRKRRARCGREHRAVAS
eukprot:764424-Pleurochrysis_carterae.AAC.1